MNKSNKKAKNIKTSLSEWAINESEDFKKELKTIADELAESMYCDVHGSCVHFAEVFVQKVFNINPNLLYHFYVIEGYVDTPIGDGIPQEHTWIELKDGEKIDPTFEQFSKYGESFYLNKIKNKFTGLEYYEYGEKGTWFSEKRKKRPELFFKKKP